MTKRKRDKSTTIVMPQAPAVHSDALWDAEKLDGGMVHNIGHEPQKLDTKQDYFDALNKAGLRMKDQQESSTGPELEPVATPEPVAEVAPSLTGHDASNFMAFKHFLDRYRLQEAIWCSICWDAGRETGCRVTEGVRSMTITCRCASRHWKFSTDLSYTSSSAITIHDKGVGEIVDAHGARIVPTIAIQSDDAMIALRHNRSLEKLRLNHSLRCKECGNDCELLFTETKIGVACGCLIRHWQSTVN